jgi:hypothetical protein
MVSLESSLEFSKSYRHLDVALLQRELADLYAKGLKETYGLTTAYSLSSPTLLSFSVQFPGMQTIHAHMDMREKTVTVKGDVSKNQLQEYVTLFTGFTRNAKNYDIACNVLKKK